MQKIFTFCGIVFFFYVQAQMKTYKDRLSVDFFGDYYYNVLRDTLFTSITNNVLQGATGMHGFQIRRLDINFQHQFNSSYTFIFTASSEESDFLPNGKNSFGIKQAYFQKDSLFQKDISIYAGISPNPAIFYKEKWGEYRFLEKTITTLRIGEFTNDLGVGFRASFLHSFFLHILVGNNSGSKLETDKYKSFFGVIGFKPSEKWIFTIEGTYHDQKKIIDVYDTGIPQRKLSNDKWILSCFGGVELNRVKIGLTYFFNQRMHDFNNGASLINYSLQGLSLFWLYNFHRSHGLMGRFDYYDPNLLIKENLRWYAILAYLYKPLDGIILSPNVQVEFYSPVGSTTYKPSVTARITLSMKF